MFVVGEIPDAHSAVVTGRRGDAGTTGKGTQREGEDSRSMALKDVLLLLNNQFVRRCRPFHCVYTFFSHTDTTHANRIEQLTRPHTHALLTPQTLSGLEPTPKQQVRHEHNEQQHHETQRTLDTVDFFVC
jgi:hypothetical protein